MPNFQIFYYFGERSRHEIGYLYSLQSVIIIQTPLYIISTNLKVKSITQNHHSIPCCTDFFHPFFFAEGKKVKEWFKMERFGGGVVGR